MRKKMRLVPERPPATLGNPYDLALPPMRVAAWPHLGAGTGAAATWIRFGRWGRERGLLTPHTLPVSVLYDDEGITPSAHARLDAALVIAPDQTFADTGDLPFVYDLPGGRHVITPFEGSVHQLEAAWDYFALRWFPASGHALRDTRLLMLHDAADVPTRACDFFPLVLGRNVRCRLCIPIDHVPAPGLPPIQMACMR
jgi:DNA gyrase inhibitor GyrI